ncbi:MAG: TIGR03862 family flavoprotein [Alphaproteobacteria bacterium]|nr:TIGR03862 family flavoprotein [Alphaproteobacteria bacterium]
MTDVVVGAVVVGAVVVGAGPAGLAAAEMLAEGGCAVTVLERMPSPARKLLMAGRGGLNITHSEPLDAFLARYGAARPWLEPAITGFPPEAVREWCAGLGIETFVGSSGRVFPRAMKASPLLRAWLTRLSGMGVKLLTRHEFRGWDAAGNLLAATPSGESRFTPGATVLAMGGASWPRLGADGGWVTLLDGSPIAPLAPANCGFRADWSPLFRDRFAGQPLKRIALTFAGQTRRGEAVITATGIEGGAIYALSSPLRDAIAAAGPVTLHIDLRPDLTYAALAARIGMRGGQSIGNVLRKSAGLDAVQAGLVQEALHAGARSADLAGLIKAIPLRLTAPQGLDRAISTAGGVMHAAVDGGFMLTARPGVFVAGEMLDWEAPTGGYLLQACLATGRQAGKEALRFLRDAA